MKEDSVQKKVLIFGVICGFLLSFWLLKVDQNNFSAISRFITNYESFSFGAADSQNISLILDKEVKILCWVMTSPQNKFRWQPIKNTWGKKCTKLLFMSSETYYNEGDGIEVVGLSAGEGRQNLWAKTKEGFIYAFRNHYEDFDWFMKIDDDTYIIMENLKHLLYQYNSNQSLFLGARYTISAVAKGYMAGMSYILSRKALHTFYHLLMENKCRNDSGGAEDAEIGKCLANKAVQVDTRDSDGRHRFFPVPITSALNPFGTPYWYQFNQYYKLNMGMNCCSDNPIGFHYTSPECMYALDYFFYSVYPFGSKDIEDALPEKISTEKLLLNSMGVDFM